MVAQKKKKQTESNNTTKTKQKNIFNKKKKKKMTSVSTPPPKKKPRRVTLEYVGPSTTDAVFEEKKRDLALDALQLRLLGGGLLSKVAMGAAEFGDFKYRAHALNTDKKIRAKLTPDEKSVTWTPD